MSCNCNRKSEIYGTMLTYPTEDLIDLALSRGIPPEKLTKPDFEMSNFDFDLCDVLHSRYELRNAWLDYCNQVAGEIIC